MQFTKLVKFQSFIEIYNSRGSWLIFMESVYLGRISLIRRSEEVGWDLPIIITSPTKDSFKVTCPVCMRENLQELNSLPNVTLRFSSASLASAAWGKCLQKCNKINKIVPGPGLQSVIVSKLCGVRQRGKVSNVVTRHSSNCRAQVQVKVQVRSRSGRSGIDLSLSLFLVFTTHPPPPPPWTIFLALKGPRQVR